MEKIKDKIKTLKGEVVIKNLTTGEEQVYKNLVVDTGREQAFRLIAGNSTDFFDWTAFGTGTSAPSTVDTAMETEVLPRIQVNSKNFSSNYFEFVTIVTGNEQVGTWRELGTFNASTSGILFARLALNFTHTAGDIVQITWRWTSS